MENKEPSVEPTLDEIISDIREITSRCYTHLKSLRGGSLLYLETNEATRKQAILTYWIISIGISDHETKQSVDSQLKRASDCSKLTRTLLTALEHNLEMIAQAEGKDRLQLNLWTSAGNIISALLDVAYAIRDYGKCDDIEDNNSLGN